MTHSFILRALENKMRLCLLIVICLANSPVTSAQVPQVQAKFGVTEKADGIAPGYTLLSPLSAHRTFLINNDGKVVHYWQADRKPGQASYLLNDGCLLRAGKVDNFFQFPETAGSGGRIQKYDWDGELIWDYTSSSQYRMSHHDIEPMPNGNVLCIVWESYVRTVAEQAGRNPALLVGDVLWFEAIFELKPTGLNSAEIVWKWSLRDHLIQDWDKSKDNFGDPAEHPELLDINFINRPVADWVHMNSIDYNPQLDQILVGTRSLSELWIIDHSTTTEEAATHSGGKRGRGGDLLYRWGNPRTYRRGDEDERMLFNQHDAHWIPPEHPGAGHILVFNNGMQNSSQDYSSVDEIVPPINPDGTYRIEQHQSFGPKEPVWSYDEPGKLFSPRISGVQRLPNGNTLICSGTQYQLREVTNEGEMVWQYVNPPRYRNPPGPNGRTSKPSLADLPSQRRQELSIPGGIPLEDGGTLFKVMRYAPDYSAFLGVDLTPMKIPARNE